MAREWANITICCSISSINRPEWYNLADPVMGVVPSPIRNKGFT
jgi:hypothetical protein